MKHRQPPKVVRLGPTALLIAGLVLTGGVVTIATSYTDPTDPDVPKASRPVQHPGPPEPFVPSVDLTPPSSTEPVQTYWRYLGPADTYTRPPLFTRPTGTRSTATSPAISRTTSTTSAVPSSETTTAVTPPTTLPSLPTTVSVPPTTVTIPTTVIETDIRTAPPVESTVTATERVVTTATVPRLIRSTVTETETETETATATVTKRVRVTVTQTETVTVTCKVKPNGVVKPKRCR